MSRLRLRPRRCAVARDGAQGRPRSRSRAARPGHQRPRRRRRLPRPRPRGRKGGDRRGRLSAASSSAARAPAWPLRRARSRDPLRNGPRHLHGPPVRRARRRQRARAWGPGHRRGDRGRSGWWLPAAPSLSAARWARSGTRAGLGRSRRSRPRGSLRPSCRARGGTTTPNVPEGAGGAQKRTFSASAGIPDSLGARVDVDVAPVGEPAQGHAAVGGELDRQRARGAYADEDRRRLPPSDELRRRAGLLTQRTRPERGMRPSRRAQPRTLSTALWRPTSSRARRSSPVASKRPVACRPPSARRPAGGSGREARRGARARPPARG